MSGTVAAMAAAEEAKFAATQRPSQGLRAQSHLWFQRNKPAMAKNESWSERLEAMSGYRTTLKRNDCARSSLRGTGRIVSPHQPPRKAMTHDLHSEGIGPARKQKAAKIV